MALAFPPDSCLIIHWQQDWFQLEYLEHQAEGLCGLAVVPQGHEGHFPPGQLTPQVPAKLLTAKRAIMMATMYALISGMKSLNNYYINISLYDL
jgi:hypothetical protein